MRLALALGSLLALVAKDGTAPAPPAPRSLPPGLWFVEGHYESFALEEEPEPPRFAVVAGIHASASRAEATLRRAARARLDDGYPWVVTTRDVPLEATPPDRIAVIVGLHRERAAADALAARVGARVIAIADTAHEPVWGRDGLEERLWVVQVDSRHDAPGYPLAAMRAIEAELDAIPFETEEARRAAFEARLARVRVCPVRAGSVYATRSSARYYGPTRRFAPARCGGRDVLVPVEHTLREAVFEYRAAETWIHQVTDVTCDSASFDVWRWTEEGREVIAGREPSFRSGCAG